MGEQALSVIKQAIDLALASGVYKNTQDVVLIHNSLIELNKILKESTAIDDSIKESNKSMKEDAAKAKSIK